MVELVDMLLKAQVQAKAAREARKNEAGAQSLRLLLPA